MRAAVTLLAVWVTGCATDSGESTGDGDLGVVRGEGGQPGESGTSTTDASLDEVDAACAKLSLQECEASDSCFALSGWPVDLERQCILPELSPISPVACMGSHNSCPDAISVLRSPEGDCWQLPGCSVSRPGWSGSTDDYNICPDED